MASPHEQATQERPGVVRHEWSTPLWRLLGVLLAGAGVGVASYYLGLLGQLPNVAIVLSVALTTASGFWARRQREQLYSRLGPFGEIGTAVVNSRERIDTWATERSWRAGLAVGLARGVLLVLIKIVVEWSLGWLASPWMAAAVGLVVASAVVAPEMWRAARDRAAGRQQSSR